jgi:hypothetical protein
VPPRSDQRGENEQSLWARDPEGLAPFLAALDPLTLRVVGARY